MMISAMVDFNTFAIDDLQRFPWFLTIDASTRNGHQYANKAPGAAMIAVPVYWLIKKTVPAEGLPVLSFWHRYLVNVFTNGLLFAIAGLVLFRIGRKWSGDDLTAILGVLAFGLGSIAWTHSQYFSGHLMAGLLYFLGFSCLMRLQQPGVEQGGLFEPILAFSGGFFTGFGFACEYTSIFLIVALFGYLLWLRRPFYLVLLFVLGAAFPLLLLFNYNYQCFGSVFSTGYHHLALDEFADGTAQGFLGIGFPRPGALFGLLFSPSRGLFFLMPVYCFSIIGLWRMWHTPRFRPEMLVIGTIVLWYILLIGGYFNWHGGWTYGPRYLVPMIPFLTLPLYFSPARSGAWTMLLIVSILLMMPAVFIMPHTPPEFKNPIIELMLPLMRMGYLPDTLFSALGFSKSTGLIIGLFVIALLVSILLVLGYQNRTPLPDTEAGRIFHRILAACATAAIILSLMFIRSPEQDRAVFQGYTKQLFKNYRQVIKYFK